MKIAGLQENLKLPYHQAILNDEIPLILLVELVRHTYMYLLRTAHLGEVTVTIWPKQLKDNCSKKNIFFYFNL